MKCYMVQFISYHWRVTTVPFNRTAFSLDQHFFHFFFILTEFYFIFKND